jgi:hypothetical protein
MSAQLCLDFAPRLKPSAQAILDVLSDGEEHSALEFKRGVHGFYADAVSQRIGEINRAGYRVRNVGGNRVGIYRLEVS